MKRLLVPTDFSPAAEKAFRFAVDLAQRAGSSIILYHVHIPLENVFIGTMQSRKQYNERCEKNIRRRLQRLIKKVIEGISGVEVSAVIGRPPLVGSILDFAAINQVNLIVMGTQGCSGLKRVIVGSVSARIADRSDRPVLLVPEKYVPGETSHFVFATKSSGNDQAALSIVEEIAKLYDAAITVLHFQDICEPVFEKEKDKHNFEQYACNQQRRSGAVKVRYQLLDAISVIEAMETLDQRVPYDVMVMVRRNKTFLKNFFVKSITKNMAYVTQKPLLVIPEQV
ncbi:universal stress protein [Pseudoflavitalea rhizosphaerae]|uniref:universal stress protein n=1 Tax=Pseudoflavitalea rhizosphaerae TaxID=1884793 RepID=UPI000F8E50F1|nr:universal stress protein [Pseudoflavitalea rhizosphaerae]